MRAVSADCAPDAVLDAARILLPVRGLAPRVWEWCARAARVRERAPVGTGKEGAVVLAQLERAVGAAAGVALRRGVRRAREGESEEGEGGGEGKDLHGWVAGLESVLVAWGGS